MNRDDNQQIKTIDIGAHGHGSEVRGGKIQGLNPDYVARKFVEDARRRARRRILVLQVPDNKADSVKLRSPCGFKCLRIYHELNSPFG